MAVFEWIEKRLFSAYEKRKKDIEVVVVKRFSRGNIRVQDGSYLNEEALEELSSSAEPYFKRLSSKAQ